MEIVATTIVVVAMIGFMTEYVWQLLDMGQKLFFADS